MIETTFGWLSFEATLASRKNLPMKSALSPFSCIVLIATTRFMLSCLAL